MAVFRDIPDPVFTGYRIHPDIKFHRIPDIFLYRIPDNTGYRIMLNEFNVSNSLTPGAFYYTYRIIVVPPLLFIFTLTFKPLCNIHVCMLYTCSKSHRFRNLINVNLLSFPFFRSTDEVCSIELRTFILNLKASNCVCYVYQCCFS